MLRGMMTDAAPAAHEQHGQRQDPAKRHRVMSGPARQLMGANAEAFDAGDQQLHCLLYTSPSPRDS